MNLLQQQLTHIFWKLNYLHFGGILLPIKIQFSNHLKSTGGQYFKKPNRKIQVSTQYLKMNHAWQEIYDTLGHEMVHYWLDFLGRPCGHTKEFKKKLITCGFNRYSRLTPVHARHIYLCYHCGTRYFRRRRGNWSCGSCSGSRYNPAYRLTLLGVLPNALSAAK